MKGRFSICLLLSLACVAGTAQEAAHLKTVSGTAFHILPRTNNRESGYASICEGLNGRIYIGTAAYGVNSYLVEFDPKTETQRVVIDTHKLCGLSATGFAAQAKIHTRNFVGPSGTIYVGSKQGHPLGGESPWTYPGGYLMTYDPATEKAVNLGKVPFRLHGIYDVVADESRDLLYVTTQSEGLAGQLWFRYDLETHQFEGLGPIVSAAAHPLLDRQGRCHVLTEDLRLATYDPDDDSLFVRPILEANGNRFTHAEAAPQWEVDPEGQKAFLIFMDDSIMYEIDLMANGPEVPVKNHGPVIEAQRTGVSMDPHFGPDGKFYLIAGALQPEVFPRSLSHLVRFDPRTEQSEDLGVITIGNPDYVQFKDVEGKPFPNRRGVVTLPDGQLTPVYNQGLAVCRDGTLYAKYIKPFTLLRIDDVRAATAPH